MTAKLVGIALFTILTVFSLFGHKTETVEDEGLLNQLIRDRCYLSEGIVECYRQDSPTSWILRSTIHYGHRPPAGYRNILPWGVLSKERSKGYPENVGVQLRDMKLYFLINGKWELFDCKSRFGERVNCMPEGGTWPDDMSYRAVKPDEKRVENDGCTYFQPRDGDPKGAGRVIHWWAKKGKIDLPPEYDGILVTIEARLVKRNESEPAGFEPNYVIILGGDFRPAAFPNIPSFATGRGKYVTPEWKTYYAISLTEEELRRAPLPPLKGIKFD
jgi:hypothetical protein